MGRKKQPHYRVVATDIRSPRDGKCIEEIGWYDPRAKTWEIDADLAKKWLSQGAQPTETVKGLFIRAGICEKSARDPKNRRAPLSVRNAEKRRSTTPKKEAPASVPESSEPSA